MGNDIRHMDNFTIDLVTSEQVLAVNQDPQCVQGSMVRRMALRNVDQAPLRRIVCGFIMNKADFSANTTVYFDNGGELWGSGVDFFPAIFDEMLVHDLGTGTDLGIHSSTFTTTVPAHDALLFKMLPPSSIKSKCTNYTRYLEGNQCDDKFIIGVGSMRGTVDACFAWCQETGLCKFFSFSGNDTDFRATRERLKFVSVDMSGAYHGVSGTVCVPRKVHATNYNSYR